MGLAAQLHATLALAYHSITPPASAPLPSAGSGPPYGVTGDQIPAALAHMDRFTGSDGTLAIIFRDAHFLAAPFLLFRLKRSGFSACRVARVPEGLLLTARR